MTEPAASRVVAVLVFPGVQLLDAAGPLQVFATANDYARAAGETPPYRPRLIAPQAGNVASSAGVTLMAAGLPRGAAQRAIDTVLVAGGPGIDALARDATVLAWLRRSAGTARRVVSVCTGAFLLAEAGLLDRRRATTHWRRAAELAERYPAVAVDADAIHVRDGTIWSSAGVTAGIDLALALVEEDLGPAAALAVARHLVVFNRRAGGQSQFSAAAPLPPAAAPFADLHDWMARNLSRPLTLPSLAQQAGMSERSFLRHYRAATGLSPARMVERMRVEAARRALAESRAPVKAIARRCGFGSEETMRRSFLRQIAVPPLAYRQRFGTV